MTMGLDVYLYKCADRKQAKQIEEQYESKCEAIWKKHTGDKAYGDCTEAEKDAAHRETKKLAKAMGIGEYGSHSSVEKVELDSVTDAKHLFKIGYFRSSYNDGGINSWLRRMGQPDLYWVFGQKKEPDYEFTPNWKQVKQRALKIVEALDALGDDASLDCFDVTPNLFTGPHEKVVDEKSAMLAWQETVAGRKADSDFTDFENGYGHFFMNGFKVLALIPGVKEFLGRKLPATYVVYRKEDGVKWYQDALRIVAETADYVLAQDNPKDFYVHWSA